MVSSRAVLRAATCLSFAAFAAAVPFPSFLQPRQTTCYSGVYIIAARGTEESAGYGSTQQVVSDIIAAIPNSGSYAVNYPASALNPPYPESVTDGINDVISHIQSYVNSCKGKIVLVGFSQGGNVMTDTLAGGVLKPTPISASYAAYIVGITVFGDPTFTHGQSFDQGTATGDGIFSRGGSSLALLNTYASKLKSYCNNGDIYCDSGTDPSVHGMEVPTYAQDATNFIVQLNSAFQLPGGTPSAAPSGASSAAPTGAPSSFSAYPGYSTGAPSPSSVVSSAGSAPSSVVSSQPSPSSGGGGYSSAAPSGAAPSQAIPSYGYPSVAPSPASPSYGGYSGRSSAPGPGGYGGSGSGTGGSGGYGSGA